MDPVLFEEDRLPPDDFRLLDLHDRLASDGGPSSCELYMDSESEFQSIFHLRFFRPYG